MPMHCPGRSHLCPIHCPYMTLLPSSFRPCPCTANVQALSMQWPGLHSQIRYQSLASRALPIHHGPHPIHCPCMPIRYVCSCTTHLIYASLYGAHTLPRHASASHTLPIHAHIPYNAHTCPYMSCLAHTCPYIMFAQAKLVYVQISMFAHTCLAQACMGICLALVDCLAEEKKGKKE